MKQVILMLLTLFVGKALACWADYGEQDSFTARAASDLTSHQYLVMRLVAAGAPPTCNIASNNLSTSAAGLAAGFLQNNPNSGQAATVARSGLTKGKAGAAVTALALVTHDTSGFVIDAVSGSTVIGRAMEAAAAANEIISVMAQYPVKWGSVA